MAKAKDAAGSSRAGEMQARAERAAARHERNEMIVGLRARGVSERTVAATLGVSRTTVQQAMREFRATNPTLRTVDPIEIIDEMLIGYQADLEELASVSASAKSENAKVGAINARMGARDRIVYLLQATGVLPRDLGKLKVEIEVRYIAHSLVTILNKYGIGDEIRDELLAALRGGDMQAVGALSN